MVASEVVVKSLISAAVTLGIAFAGAISNEFGKSVLSVNSTELYIPYSQLYFNLSFYIFVYPVYVIYAVTFLKKTIKETFVEDMELFPKWRFRILSVLVHTVPFFVVAILNTYAYARGLSKISASAAGVLIGVGPIVVFLESLVILREKFLVRKLFAAFFVAGGVVPITMDDEFAGSTVGIILVIAAAAGMGTYNVLFKKVFGRIPLGKVCLFLSIVGVLNIVFNIIPTVILVKEDIDHIEWEYVPWGALIGAAVLNLVNQFLTNFGIALLNPLIVSIGLICGLPVTNAIDVIFRHMKITWKLVLGVVLILIAFLLISIPIEEIIAKRLRKSNPNDVDAPELKDEINSVSGSSVSDNTSSTLPVKDAYDMAYQSGSYLDPVNKKDFLNL